MSAAPKTSAIVISDDAVITAPPVQVFYLSKSIPDGYGSSGIEFIESHESIVQLQEIPVGESTALYSVEEGNSFGLAYVTAALPIISGNHLLTRNSIEFALRDVKLFGYWNDRNYDFQPSEEDNYGWVRIMRTPSGFVASDGATAIGRGIIIGTMIQMPEPSAASIAAFGMFCLVIYRQRTHHGCKE
jgi:hypothetical protein